MWLTHWGEDPRYSSCVYEVPILDWKGRRDWIKARGVSYVTPSEQRDMPEGAMEAFPKISLSGVTVSQAAGPVDMIIGRDNPEWMPVPVQEEPHERFTMMWTSLSPGQRGSGLEAVAAKGGRGTSCDPDGGPIGGVYGTA